MTRPYVLPSHVRACRTEDAIVLLDLREGKYHALGLVQGAMVRRSVQNWPREPGSENHDHDTTGAFVSRAEGIVKALASRGLVMQIDERTSLEPPCEIQSIEQSVEVDESAAITWRDVLRLANAYLRASLLLRFFSLERLVVRVNTRRQEAGRDVPIDIPRTQAIMGTYQRLRPWFFTARHKCLLDSLVLIEFLSMQRVFPHLVLGVRTGPFGAHSWVQADEVVLNSSAEYARGFSPILVA